MSDDRASFNGWFRTEEPAPDDDAPRRADGPQAPPPPRRARPEEPDGRPAEEPGQSQTAVVRPRHSEPDAAWAPTPQSPGLPFPGDSGPEAPGDRYRRPPAPRGPVGYGPAPQSGAAPIAPATPAAPTASGVPDGPRRGEVELRGPRDGGATRIQPSPGRDRSGDAPVPPSGIVELRGRDDQTRVQPPHPAPDAPRRGELELRGPRDQDATRVQQPTHGRPDGSEAPRSDERRGPWAGDDGHGRPAYAESVRDAGADQPWQPDLQEPAPQRGDFHAPEGYRPTEPDPAPYRAAEAETRFEPRFAPPPDPRERDRAVYEESGFYAPAQGPRTDPADAGTRRPDYDDQTRSFAPEPPYGRDDWPERGGRDAAGPRAAEEFGADGYGRDGYGRDGFGPGPYGDPRDPRGAAAGPTAFPGAQGPGPHGRGQEAFTPAPAQPKRRRKGVAVAAVAVVAVAGVVGYMMVSGGKSGAGSGKTDAAPKPTHTAFQPTSSDPVVAAEQTGTAFLTAWATGDLQKAASLTDDPTDALTALTAYKADLNLSSLTLTPGPATAGDATASPSASASATASGGTSLSGLNEAATPSTGATAATATAAPDSGTVPFKAVATVTVVADAGADATGTPDASASANADGTSGSAAPASAPWSYSSKLVAHAVQGGWAVQWSPTILAPGMTASEHLTVAAVTPGVDRVTDADGDNLASSSQLALHNIAGLIAKSAPTGSGTPGISVALADSSGKPIKSTQATVLSPVNVPSLKTTIDPSMESLAATAVAQMPRSSMVVLRPSTGAILAIANSAGTPDTALTGTLAPGSTMKMITSTAALNIGLVTPSTPRGCPLVFTVQGVSYHNATNSKNVEESLPDSTPFIDDFADSCNNAFTTMYPQLEGGKLASAASTYYGLNQPWDIGLGTSEQYFTMPHDSSGAELAQEDFGQGQIEACPLSMVAVGSTIVEGTFHQPYLVAGGKRVTATTLPSGTDADLKEMMHAVVASPIGTAYGVFSNTSGLYAKTGTAEAGPATKQIINGWIVVVDPAQDIAVAGVVVDTPGDGASSAGVEAAWLLRHL